MWLRYFIIITTALLLYFYLTHNAALLHKLAETSPITISKLLILYSLWFGTLALILQACLRICRQNIPTMENLILNAYSIFSNYLFPGQSGPVIRGIYLKGRYKVALRNFIFVTLLYYLAYAGVSVILLVGGMRSWWQTILGILLFSTGAFIGARSYARKQHINIIGLDLSLENVAFLLFATCLQAICQIAIYYVELSSVATGLKVGQVISYTGAANFALFVSLTPGAVGIRETFLFFSENLHHITGSAIVAANILDRSTFIVFLVLVFSALLVVRGKYIFSIKKEMDEISSELPDAQQVQI